MTSHIPKVELHCHFEGTISPELMIRMAARNGLEIPDGVLNAEGNYVWSDFLEFLNAYDQASAVIRAPKDYRDIAYEYLMASAKEGAIYVEFFTSPDHANSIGIGYEEMNTSIAQGIDDAERDSGIVGRMITTCVRHFGPESALNVAQIMVDKPHPYVVGFGMGGDENQFAPKDFAPAFNLVNEAGYPCTVHAGEVSGASSVSDALDALPVKRIGHGVRSIEDENLIRRIVDEEIVLEVCPGSNLALGLFTNASNHPLNDLIQKGCRVTLSSDDPPFFFTSIGAEYERASTDFGITEQKLLEISKVALEAAFVDQETKDKLRARI